MTTDTDPLEDRLWDAIFAARDLPGKTGEASTVSIVEAILPIIAAEVRAARAEAWDECVRAAHAPEGRITHGPNPYETGDQA